MELRIVTDERPKSGRPMHERTYGRVMNVLKLRLVDANVNVNVSVNLYSA